MNSVFRSAAFWLRIAAYGIPLVILLSILYLNYLPFGYDKTFVIEAGVAGDADGQFRILNSGGISKRLSSPENGPYRQLISSTYAIFKPSAILRNATATVSVSDEGVFLISPHLDLDPMTLEWEYEWNMLEGEVATCKPFDGLTTREVVPDLTAALDDGAFSVYAEWTPEDPDHAFQQIVGRYYWELVQNKDDVEFYVSVADGEEGIRSVRYMIDDSKFFAKKHTALAMYAPASATRSNGYLDLYVDEQFAGRTYFANETIQKDLVVEDRPITLGKSGHSDASFFRGCISDIKITKHEIDTTVKEASFKVTRDRKEYAIPLINNSPVPSTLTNIRLHVVQE